MKGQYTDPVKVARDYYNSDDADNFYSLVWGGEDIHVGVYRHPDEQVYNASRRAVALMAEQLPRIDADTRVIDLGSGYGGSMRWLAREYGCPTVGLNLSERENERGRRQNAEQGLDHLVEIVDGSYEDVPYQDESFDVVWSQDAMLHSGNRRRVLEEAVRILRPGGHFVFTDPMQVDGCSTEELEPILARLHLSTLGSPAFYRENLGDLGLEEVTFVDRSEMIPAHYGRVRDVLAKEDEYVSRHVSRDYIDRMSHGLKHWVEGGRQGNLTWGVFVFRKPENRRRH